MGMKGIMLWIDMELVLIFHQVFNVGKPRAGSAQGLDIAWITDVPLSVTSCASLRSQDFWN